MTTIADFTVATNKGEPLELKDKLGTVLLVVNTASKCGFTPQYDGLEELYQRFGDRGFEVLAFPCNQFGGQEPGDAGEIAEFCKVNFDVDFPMTKKVRIRNDTPHPFYAWAYKELGGIAKPRWNFHKYLVAPNGRLVEWFSSPTSPLSIKVTKAIETNLPE